MLEFSITGFVPSGVPYDLRVSPEICQPSVSLPILPDVALISPLMKALLALNAPAEVTLNGVLLSRTEDPAQIANVPDEAKPTVVAPVPALNFVASIDHPPISPSLLNKYPSRALTSKLLVLVPPDTDPA